MSDFLLFFIGWGIIVVFWVASIQACIHRQMNTGILEKNDDE